VVAVASSRYLEIAQLVARPKQPVEQIWRPTAVRTFFEGEEEQYSWPKLRVRGRPGLRPLSALFATAAKQTQSLNAAAQFAPKVDEVIAPIIRIDLLEFHCLVTDNTIHQI